jgi:uncharacterized protein (DUF2267 family)
MYPDAMEHDEFIGSVQQRADLAGRGEADSATRAVLSTLGERVTADEAEDLAAQLPLEIGRYLTDEAEHGQQFDAEAFLDRVAELAEAGAVESDPEEATRAVFDVTIEAAGTGQLQDVVTQFPENEGYGRLLGDAHDES